MRNNELTISMLARTLPSGGELANACVWFLQVFKKSHLATLLFPPIPLRAALNSASWPIRILFYLFIAWDARSLDSAAAATRPRVRSIPNGIQKPEAKSGGQTLTQLARHVWSLSISLSIWTSFVTRPLPKIYHFLHFCPVIAEFSANLESAKRNEQWIAPTSPISYLT